MLNSSKQQDNSQSISEGSMLQISKNSKRIVVLGYKEELMRGINFFMAFTLSLTNSAFATSILIQLGFGLQTGGPLSMLWGWIIVGLFVIFQSMAIAEICSAYPAEGGSYFWTGVIAPERYAPILSYIVGWTYLLASLTAGASFVSSVPIIISGITETTVGYAWSEYLQVGFTIFLILLMVVKGRLRIDHQGYFHDIAGIVQIGGTLLIIVIIFAFSSSLSSTSFVFTGYNNDTGFKSEWYVLYIGSLMTTYTLVGFEAAGTCAEETINQTTTASKGIVYNSVVSYVMGIGFIIALLYGCQENIDFIINSTNSSTVNLYSIIFSGNYKGIVSMALIQFLMTFLISFTNITVGSRILFAMSRDKAIPFPRYFYYVNKETKAPDRIIWLIFVMQSLICCLPLISKQAFTLICQTTAVCYQITYIIPIALRLSSYGRETFDQSDWNLGRFSVLIHWIALISLIITTIALLLPTSYDETYGITAANFNYTPVIMLGFYGVAFIYWNLPKPYGAKHVFFGPRKPNIVFSIEDSHNGSIKYADYMTFTDLDDVD